MTSFLTAPAISREHLAELLNMLSYKRPHGSKSERRFVDRFIAPLGTSEDSFGNHWLTIGDAPILWSSHTDTVHKTPGLQKLVYGDGAITSESGECLGADCTAGVWLMVQMIRAGVPGTYLFHRGEEVGGLGSAFVAKHTPDRLRSFQFAIAFDRKGSRDVITHQGTRTASEAFARSLCEVLKPLDYAPDDSGTFTDTANYAHIIPECSNISVGYHRAHSKDEWQDVRHLVTLLGVLTTADWTRLECARDPEQDNDDPIWSWSGKGFANDAGDLKSYVYDQPGLVAMFLEAQGYSVDDIAEFGEEHCR